jgi:hypothetical protein
MMTVIIMREYNDPVMATGSDIFLIKLCRNWVCAEWRCQNVVTYKEDENKTYLDDYDEINSMLQWASSIRYTYVPHSG